MGENQGRIRIAFSRIRKYFAAGEGPIAVYLMVLAAAAGSIAAVLELAHVSIGNAWIVLALALSAAAAERETVRISTNVEVSVGLLPTIFAAVVFGPAAAMVVSAASMLGDFRRPYSKWAIYTCSRSITGAAAGGAAVAADALVNHGVAAIATGTVLAALVSEVLDVVFVSLTVMLRRSGRPLDGARALIPVVVGSLPLFTPVVALLAYAYEEISLWTLPLFLAPAFAAQRLSILYQEQRRLAEDLGAMNVRLERANLSFATALVATLDARDRYTAGHSATVAVYARDIAARMGLSDAEQRLAHVCGLVHDIGKVGLPAGLLEKGGPLTREERGQMEDHAAIGERILANVEDYAEIASIVRHHHERVDGNGYPDRLTAQEIPLVARIISVADAYNAMTSDRPYRSAMPSHVARVRLAQAVETQFDTGVVAAFEAVLTAADAEYRAGVHPDFAFDAQARSADLVAAA